MKVTKEIRKKYPKATFGKVQKVFRCQKEIKRIKEFKQGNIYEVDDGGELVRWVCLEVGQNPQESIMQQVFGLEYSKEKI